MKFLHTVEVEGQVWVHVEGTAIEIRNARQWIATNKTMWVMDFPEENRIIYGDGAFAAPSAVIYMLGKLSRGQKLPFGAQHVIYKKFCFKSKSDAVRFKLSHS